MNQKLKDLYKRSVEWTKRHRKKLAIAATVITIVVGIIALFPHIKSGAHWCWNRLGGSSPAQKTAAASDEKKDLLSDNPEPAGEFPRVVPIPAINIVGSNSFGNSNNISVAVNNYYGIPVSPAGKVASVTSMPGKIPVYDFSDKAPQSAASVAQPTARTAPTVVSVEPVYAYSQPVPYPVPDYSYYAPTYVYPYSYGVGFEWNFGGYRPRAHYRPPVHYYPSHHQAPPGGPPHHGGHH